MKRRSFDESDLIRLRLQRLDRLTLSAPPDETLFASAPILAYAVAFIVGIWLLDVFPMTNFWFLLFPCLLLSAALLFVSRKFAYPASLWITLSAACLTFFAAGFARHYASIHVGPDHISRCLLYERQLATLKGVVISPVVNTEKDASIPWVEPHSSFYLQTQSILSEGQWLPVTGVVRVQVGQPLRHVRPGNEVLIYCWLSRFAPPPNPGQFDLRKYMARKGVYLAASVPVSEGVEVIDPSISSIHAARSFVSLFCEDSLLDDSLPDRSVRDMSAALLLGRRENLDPEIMAAFQKTNLAHYISLSGQNVGILAGSLWFLLRTFGLPKRPRALLCILLIILYALAVPSMPAINRAVFLACFIFSSFLLRRRSQPLNTLALSAIVLLLFRPSELFSVGWQLSFLSVLGILILYEPVVYYLRTWVLYPAVFAMNQRFVWLQSLLSGLLDLTAVGVAAWLAIAGLLLYYFGSINPLSPLWTVLVFPFVLALLYAGYLKLVIAKLLPTVGAFLSVIIHEAARGFEESVLFLSKIDLTRMIARPPSIAIVVLIYIMLIILLFLPFFHRRLRLVCYTGCAFLFLQPALFQFADAFRQRHVEITCLSVGHGQAIVLTGPQESILFDAGSITNRDIASKTILPFLQQKGISSLNAVYISHGDLDHINAVAEIPAYIDIQKLYANGAFLTAAAQSSGEKQLSLDLSRFDVIPEPVADYSDEAGLTIKSLWPLRKTAEESGISDNDQSEVLLIEFAGRRLLLCGDIELYAQQQLLSLYPDLRVDALVLPHHGSTVNMDERFIERLAPRIVIASGAVSRAKNAWKPDSSCAVKSFYTGLDGAVTIKIKADGTLSADGFLISSVE